MIKTIFLDDLSQVYNFLLSFTRSDWKVHDALLHPEMENGRIIHSPSLEELAKRATERLQVLPTEYKRFDNPHIYKIGISEKLRNEKNHLKNQYKKTISS